MVALGHFNLQKNLRIHTEAFLKIYFERNNGTRNKYNQKYTDTSYLAIDMH